MTEVDNRLKAEPCKVSLIKYPLVWFFAITFAFSWIIYLVNATVAKGSGIGIIGGFGPAIAAIIVAALMNPAKSQASVKKRVITFAVVFSIAMAVTFYAASRSGNPPISFYVIFTGLSLLSAYIFSSYYHPIAGVAQLFSGLKQKDKKTIWLLIAITLPIAYYFLGALINLGLGNNVFQFLDSSSLINFLTGFPYLFFFGGPTGEEPGWRGLATPQMQKYLNPLFTGIIIGFFWTTWHFPLYFTGDYTGGISALLFRLVWNVPLGVLFAWVYNKSGGNLLAVLLLHTSNNTIVSIFPPSIQNWSFAVMIAITVIVVVTTRFWRRTDKLPTIQTTALCPPLCG